ncbi:UNC-like C-terminal-domain-containing protein [Phaeosphaeria sp. MPI-PUGE-AT-0046c]|nr:UNC-like C-terminal-domain-containing protein [Phaeosphaeria sp. MPI-PUGE-AT-0046c]
MSQLGGRGATPARRSTRLSQAGSVTQQSVVTTLTTTGTRQRKAPLTKVKARKSNAYGASGRVGAAEELAPTATGFAQAFQNQRGDAVTRDDDDDEEEDDIDELAAETPYMSGGLSRRDLQSSPTPRLEANSSAPPELSFEFTEDIAPSESGIAPSIGNTSKSFGLNHEAGMLYRPLRREPPRDQVQEVGDSPWQQPLWQVNRARRRFGPQAEETEEVEVPIEPPKQAAPKINNESQPSIQKIVAEEQARLQREGPSGPRQKSRGRAARPSSNNANVDIWLGGVEDAEAGQEDEPEWKWMKYAMLLFGVLFAVIILPQVLGLSTSTEYPESASRPGLVSATGARFQHAWYGLADWISPLGNKKIQNQKTKDFLKELGFAETGAMEAEIHNTVIELGKYLPPLLTVQRRNGSLEVSDEFWNAILHKAKTPDGMAAWTDFLKQNEDKLGRHFGVPRNADTGGSQLEAVSRQEFLALVQKQYEKLSTQVNQKVSEALQGQASQIKAIAEAEARKAVIDSIALHTLAQSNLLANYELNLRKPNYFAIGLGAIVDPYLTSTTLSDGRSWWEQLYAPSRPRNPPSTALSKWEEPGDCWCVAPNPKVNGQAQLTVSMSTPVFPQQVTIEHLPMSAMPRKKITNAPRTVELWVEKDKSIRDQDAHQQQICQEGPVGWTCLGSFAYNIHASNHQQTFDLDVQSPVPVTRAMLRVTSNWGADHTCLYRVRLHGRDVQEDHQYSVHFKDPVQ